jgi:putative SOS response-associated peptidase YedK
MEAPRPETWNLAPSTRSLVVQAKAEGLTSSWLTWGFQRIAEGAIKPINARIEMAASKPLFREAWKTNRCVIPADGWFEWRTEKGRKQPYYFHRRDNQPIFFAGLWSEDSFCLFTMEAEGDLAQIHHRRPLAIRDEDAQGWIETIPSSPEKVVFCAVPEIDIAFHAVSPRVSSPRNDGPELIEPIVVREEAPQGDLF